MRADWIRGHRLRWHNSIAMPGCWALIGAIFLCDAAWCLATGARTGNHTVAIIFVLAFLAIAVFHRVTGLSPLLSDAAEGVALCAAFSWVGAVLVYAAAGTRMPLQDALFARLDAAFGFDWVSWAGFVAGQPILGQILAYAYDSMFPQIIATLVFLGLSGQGRKIAEFYWITALALIVTAAIFALLPALGPEQFYLARPPDFALDTMAMREWAANGWGPYQLPSPKGVISFPSYHTALGVALTYIHWGSRWSRWPFLALNAAMILAVPTGGGHYLVDVLAGGLIAAACAWAVRRAISRAGRPAQQAATSVGPAASGQPGR